MGGTVYVTVPVTERLCALRVHVPTQTADRQPHCLPAEWRYLADCFDRGWRRTPYEYIKLQGQPIPDRPHQSLGVADTAFATRPTPLILFDC